MCLDYLKKKNGNNIEKGLLKYVFLTRMQPTNTNNMVN